MFCCLQSQNMSHGGLFAQFLPASAPLNDLHLLETLAEFAPHDAILVDNAAARVALSRHTWCLTEKLVPLSLFSSQIQDETKEEMRKALPSQERTEVTKRVGLDHSGYGKPRLPPAPESNANLVDLVGPDSSWFFSMPCQFLHKPASEWTDHDDYLNIAQIVNKFQVVNEAAERGVKLWHDFVNLARDERLFRQGLQVVQNDRHCVPISVKDHLALKKNHGFLLLRTT
ncbi:uncharacterized protein LOC143031670 isoform X1 [Oratosquilla oratoria]|uniref:uncharacterized protein LOC143031670 isoform X1 n=1 Tax=Oratosquilla oratoria TaxID=337810 RepID=UPI003F777CFC